MIKNTEGMTKDEKIDYLIELWVELGIITLNPEGTESNT